MPLVSDDGQAPRNVARKLIESHLADGEMVPDEEVSIRVDQVLTHDATGPLIALELEAMGLDEIRPELAVGYVDHLLLQGDAKNADDHLFLRSACQRFGMWYSKPGNGISHPVHQERFGIPGKTLLGADSHTCAAGAIGMLAIGAGGLQVAVALAGEPFSFQMPEIWGVKLSGELPDWVSAKDVILEMLRRHGVSGGAGRIVEYYGPGLASLSAMDRHVIANMGMELGATTTVFPSDEEVRRFLLNQDREEDWIELVADEGAAYDVEEEIDFSELEPLIALPSSPGNVVPVREVAGDEIYQAYVGSSANPGYRDFAVAAKIVEGRQVHDRVSLDVNPSSRQVLENLVRDGHVTQLLRSGARLHQTGCNGCIGMGQAPASDRISLRTVPRNFPGRSGTPEDLVYLCSPETAAASALTGKITDPRSLDFPYPVVEESDEPILNTDMLVPPLSEEEAQDVELAKGPSIVSLPGFEPFPESLELPVLLKVSDDVSTDEILPAGTRAMPLWSSVPGMSEYAFEGCDPSYPERAKEVREEGSHAVVGGRNYGQGSSREHAALAPRYLGLRVVIAKQFARIHWENLVNFGVLPLTFADESDYDSIEQGDTLVLSSVPEALRDGRELRLENRTKGAELRLRHGLSERQIDVMLTGGLINWMRERLKEREG
ncbi:MAG: aconitate hydratase [Actinomycetota bacterium]|nr:aconitate hydratase [Actinomycetota bacterium]MDQ3926683.1 aconitate hydratase [Actinomycetota bacterium]